MRLFSLGRAVIGLGLVLTTLFAQQPRRTVRASGTVVALHSVMVQVPMIDPGMRPGMNAGAA
jgi:hypothetical protein